MYAFGIPLSTFKDYEVFFEKDGVFGKTCTFLEIFSEIVGDGWRRNVDSRFMGKD